MKDAETQHIKTIHQETEKGIRVCKFGKMFWLPKRFIDIEKTEKGYKVTAPRWIWESKRNKGSAN